MKPFVTRIVHYALLSAGTVVAFWGAFSINALLLFIGVGVLVADGVFYFIGYRCPKCKVFLGKFTYDRCPCCGTRIHGRIKRKK